MAKITEVTLEVDLEDVESFPSIPDGTYEFEITDGEIKQGPNERYINWTTKCNEVKGAIVYETNGLTPKSLWRLKGFLIALGVKEPKGKKFKVAPFIGKKFMGEVTHEPYKGRPVPKFAAYYPIGSVVSTAPTPPDQIPPETPPVEAPANADEVTFD